MTHFERIGRFEIFDRVGVDAFSILYQGRDPFSDRPVVVRVCTAGDDCLRRSFLRAAELSAELRHRNIVRVLEYGSGESKPYLVQEAPEGTSLAARMRGEQPADEVVRLFFLLQMAQGLRYAHRQGVLHGGLSPHTVRVLEGERLHLTDFGIARLSDACNQLTREAVRIPAAGYLYPENLLGLDLDERSDVFGFGALAYELLTDRRPFPSRSLPQLASQVMADRPERIGRLWTDCPGELEDTIHKCLRREPGRRFAAMDEVLEELSAVLPIPEEAAEVTTVVRDRDLEDSKTAYIVDPLLTEGGVEGKGEDGDEGESDSAPSRGGVVKAAFGTTGGAQRAVSRLVAGRKRSAAWRSGESGSHLWPALLLLALVAVSIGWVIVSRTDAKPTTKPASLPAAAPLPPQPKSTGVLIVDAQPWAEVTRVLDQKGREMALPANPFTPLSLQLPVGSYRVELAHPGVTDLGFCEAAVAEAQVAECRARLAAIEAREYFRLSGWWQ
jgi:hypothetical protein